MKKLLLALLLVATVAQAHLSPSREMLQNIGGSTYLVVTDLSMGNGVMIEDGVLLTVAHLAGTR